MQVTIEKGHRKIVIEREGALYRVWDSLYTDNQFVIRGKESILNTLENML